MTRLRRLAPLLERIVPPIPDPKLELEQYTTPAELALNVASHAIYYAGPSSSYADLGAGTCRIAGALALLGASRVIAVEVDFRLCHLCMKAMAQLGVAARVLTMCSAITTETGPLRPGSVDVVVSNPPFGVHRRGADSEFIVHTLSVLRAPLAIFIVKSGNLAFHERLAARHGYTFRLLWSDYITIPASMRHHRSRIRRVRVDIVEFRRRSGG